jgi:hypothetical protein
VAQRILLLALPDPVALPESFHFDNGFAHPITMHQESVLRKCYPKLCPTRIHRVSEKDTETAQA